MSYSNNNNTPKRTHKYFSIGAAWNQEVGYPSQVIEIDKLRQALKAHVAGGGNPEKLSIYVYDNDRKEPGTRQPDYNLTCRLPIEHYPEKKEQATNGGWKNATAGSTKRDNRAELAQQQQDDLYNRDENPHNHKEDSDVPF